MSSASFANIYSAIVCSCAILYRYYHPSIISLHMHFSEIAKTTTLRCRNVQEKVVYRTERYRYGGRTLLWGKLSGSDTE
jgi:hypothetical protein